MSRPTSSRRTARAEAVDAFAPAIESIQALDGLVDAYFLVECGGDRALSMTIWESDDAMERSRVAASRARIEAAGAVDVEVLSTYEFEVGIHGDGCRAGAGAGARGAADRGAGAR